MSLTTTILIIVIAVVILVIINLANKTAPRCIDKTHFTHEWNDIVEMSKNPKTRPMSIIKADKLLDQALKGCGYKGETMAKRLVAAKHRIKDRNAVWGAHKLRNKIAHETLFEPDEKVINSALKGYRKAFKDLGAI
jgi:hypothetical protein